MKIRTMITLGLLAILVLGAGYALTRTDLEANAAVPAGAPERAPLSVQATSLEEVQARQEPALVNQTAVFDHQIFDYNLVYPLGWDMVEVTGSRLMFRSPDKTTEVTIEAIGPLPAGDLTAFVNNSLADDIIISRQSLTVHGMPAERVLAHSDKVGGRVTYFFIDGGEMAYLVSGTGEQKPVEMIARSFNSPQPIAQR